MNKRRDNPLPLPSGLVTVEKGRRPSILVGVLTGHRQLAQGFDVSGYAPNHFRTIEPGNFGLVIAARSAVEVQAILDGKILFEGVLEPLKSPQPMGTTDAQRYQMLMETPQPHLIDHNHEGHPFVFEAPDPFADPNEIIANQINPQGNDPLAVSSLGMTKAAYPDDYQPYSAPAAEALPAVPDTAPVVSDEAGAMHGHSLSATGEGLNNAEGEAPGDDSTETMASNEAGTSAPHPVQLEATAPEAPEAEMVPVTIPLALNPHNMAPSNGFLVIGVRAIDPPVSTEEPQGPPDVFSYVGFQLNTWKFHARALSQLLNRMIVPSKEQLNNTMLKQGFAHEIPAQGPVCACCNGKTHR